MHGSISNNSVADPGGICHGSVGALKFVTCFVKDLNHERTNPLAR
jgi:hypothetical protein